MKKQLFMFVAFIAMAFSAFAYDQATCEIQGGDGASVVAEVSGGGTGVVYLNLHSDTNKWVNVTVTVTEETDVSSFTETKTFLVEPGKTTPETINMHTSWKVNPSRVTVSISGARCK